MSTSIATRWTWPWVLLAVGAGLSVPLLIVWLSAMRWAQTAGYPPEQGYDYGIREGGMDSPDPPPEERAAWEPVSKEDRVVDQFMRLRNAGNPAANLLLGPESAFPDHPVSEDEAERLQADHFLREGLWIKAIQRREYGLAGESPLPPGHYLLVTKGNVAAPALTVQTARGLERSQRTMSNPDVVVAVREGRVVALRAQLHRDPPPLQPGDSPTAFPLLPGLPRGTTPP